MNTEWYDLSLFGRQVQLLSHESLTHPRCQVIAPQTGWSFVCHGGDPYRDSSLVEEPRAAWFGPHAYADIVHPGHNVGLSVITFPKELNRSISEYLQTPLFSKSVTKYDPLLSIALNRSSINPTKVQSTLEGMLCDYVSPEKYNHQRALSTRTRRYRQAKEVGMSRRTEIQIERATNTAVAIATSEMPLCDIATTLGYYDQAHMNRVFRRHFPFSPKFLRKRGAYGAALYLDVAETYKT